DEEQHGKNSEEGKDDPRHLDELIARGEPHRYLSSPHSKTGSAVSSTRLSRQRRGSPFFEKRRLWGGLLAAPQHARISARSSRSRRAHPRRTSSHRSSQSSPSRTSPPPLLPASCPSRRNVRWPFHPGAARSRGEGCPTTRSRGRRPCSRTSPRRWRPGCSPSALRRGRPGTLGSRARR